MKRSLMVLLLVAVSCASDSSGPRTNEPVGENVLTPAGGTIVLADGAVTVHAPAGAVTRNVELSAMPAGNAYPNDAQVVRGSLYRIVATPEVTLAKPVQLELTYSAGMGPAGVPEHHYGIATASASAWSDVASATSDTAANRVSAAVSAFGLYGVRRASPAAVCTGPEHRQFDFWIGNWQVGVTQSDISGEASGCAIHEHWKAPNPGRSISVYDPRTQKWYQTYSFMPGTPAMVMSGGLEDGRMVMYVRSQAGAITDRWTWERNANGSVTQRAERTSDNGATWQPGFNGTYVRR